MENDPAVIVPEDDEVMVEHPSEDEDDDEVGAGMQQVLESSSALSDAIWENRPLEEIRAIVEHGRHDPVELLGTPGGRFAALGYLPLHDAAQHSGDAAPLDVVFALARMYPEAIGCGRQHRGAALSSDEEGEVPATKRRRMLPRP